LYRWLHHRWYGWDQNRQSYGPRRENKRSIERSSVGGGGTISWPWVEFFSLVCSKPVLLSCINRLYQNRNI
jgi:hypothetical protein